MTRRRPPPELALRTSHNSNCRAEFRPYRPSQLFCSVRCRNATKARQRRSRRVSEIARLQARVAELEAKITELESEQ
jgi:hypothetical protein